MHGLYKTSLYDTRAIASDIPTTGTITTTPLVITVPTPDITGREINARLKVATSASKRALLARDLKDARIKDLTIAQAATLAGASVSYAAAACGASAAERKDLEAGRLTLSELITKHRHPQPITDEEVGTIVRTLGPNRVLRALDEITSPMMAAE